YRQQLLLLAFVVVVDLEQHAAALGLERTVIDAGRPARISGSLERLAAVTGCVVADDEIAGHEIDLLPVIVHERCCRVDAGVEAQEPRAATHLARLVEIARQYLLLDSGGVSGWRGPAFGHIDPQELQVGLVHRHGFAPRRLMGSRENRSRSLSKPVVRAIIRIPPSSGIPMTSTTYSWPNGKRIAVGVTVMLETWSEGKAPPYGVQASPIKAGAVDLGGIAWGSYGGKVGVWRIINLLKQNGIRGTFCVNGRCAEIFPEAVEQIVKSGHDVAGHAYLQDQLMAYM